MLYQLPPVGNPIRLSGRHDEGLPIRDMFQPWTPVLLESGTSALAASVLAAISLKETSAPEVILPAYGCPDLVSAVVFAGARPVLVDLETERPWMDLEQVSANITANTVAVIAASLCGIPERLPALQAITESSGVVLIEDSAQLFPGSVAEADWQGDLVVLSFGRGKPVSLLGGGAVLFRDDRFRRVLPETQIPAAGLGQRLAFGIKGLLYNALINPRIYWILRWFPFLHIGETRYEPLQAIAPMDPGRAGSLGANITRYLEQDPGTQVAMAGMIDALADERIVNLPARCGMSLQHRLLRYPLLLDPVLRNPVYDGLDESGLGASMMYPGTLPEIPGLADRLAGQGPFPAATEFSRRLLTLPVHVGVRRVDIQTIAAHMCSLLGEKIV